MNVNGAHVKRLTLPIYGMTLSLIAVILLIGYVLWEGRQNQQILAQAVIDRQRSLNQFLRTEVCERLELRDEIELSYLRYVVVSTTDRELQRVLRDAITALEFSQRGCTAEIPQVQEGG